MRPAPDLPGAGLIAGRSPPNADPDARNVRNLEASPGIELGCKDLQTVVFDFLNPLILTDNFPYLGFIVGK